MIDLFLAGFLGGIVRGTCGYLKQFLRFKETKFKVSYFFLSCLLSGFTGAIVVIALKDIGFAMEGKFPFGLALIVGYAGGDFLENIYKIIIKKSSL